MDIQQAKDYAKLNIKQRPRGQGRLAGKIAIVTGSAQGFGLGIAKEIHGQGAAVVIADLPGQREAAEKITAELGGNAVFCPVDVSDETSVQDLICRTVELFGGLDIMISNAGVLKAGSLSDMDAKTFEFVNKVNYTGYFLCAKYAS